jgi:hypothetical protein
MENQFIQMIAFWYVKKWILNVEQKEKKFNYSNFKFHKEYFYLKKKKIE